MPAGVIGWFRPQFTDNNGNPLASGTLEFYESGTFTSLAVYSDADLNTSVGSTITLNASGFPQNSGTEIALFLLPRAYRVVVKNSGGTTLRTLDGVYALQTASSVNLDISDAVAGEALAANDLCYLSDGSNSLTAGRWYKADADLYYASVHPELGFATAAITSGGTGTIRKAGVMTGMSGLTAGSTYYVSATAGALTATAPTNARSVGVAISASTLCIDFAPPWLANGDPLSICDGRLTLTSGTAVTTADVTGATSMYFTPYTGNRVALFDGNKWKVYAFTEITGALGTLTSGLPYDVFLYDNAGTLTLEFTAWTNGTTRATALALQNGVYVKSGATTRRYLGTFYTTSTTQTEDSLAKRLLWNYYNRVPRVLQRIDQTNSWTYTNATIRQANGSTANQVETVVGVAEVPLSLTLFAPSTNTDANVGRKSGIGQGSTTVILSGNNVRMRYGTYPAATNQLHIVELGLYPAVGYQFWAWLEASGVTGTTTWYGDDGNTDELQGGLVGRIEG